MYTALHRRRYGSSTHPTVLVVGKEDRAVEYRVDRRAAVPGSAWIQACAIGDARGPGLQIREQAELVTEPAAVRVGHDRGPVRGGATSVGRVVGRVWAIVIQPVKHQAVQSIGEADPVRPAARGQHYIGRPRSPTVL